MESVDGSVSGFVFALVLAAAPDGLASPRAGARVMAGRGEAADPAMIMRRVCGVGTDPTMGMRPADRRLGTCNGAGAFVDRPVGDLHGGIEDVVTHCS